MKRPRKNKSLKQYNRKRKVTNKEIGIDVYNIYITYNIQ